MKTIGIIPARAGSQGIHAKNKKIMCGQPLVAWTIQAAQMSKSVDECLVTTDDEEIADIARGLGAHVPFLRPLELAQNDTPGIDPILHALSMVEGFDTVMILQPTSPLRTAADIDAVAEIGETVSSVVSVCKSQKPMEWTFTLNDNGSLRPLWLGKMAARRQLSAATYTLNGAIYFCDIPWLLSGGQLIDESTIPFIMPPERSIDIDTEFDWMVAEFLMSRLVQSHG
jgi:CMP-N,N'-diacetyllegionaminic acid synthase